MEKMPTQTKTFDRLSIGILMRLSLRYTWCVTVQYETWSIGEQMCTEFAVLVPEQITFRPMIMETQDWWDGCVLWWLLKPSLVTRRHLRPDLVQCRKQLLTWWECQVMRIDEKQWRVVGGGCGELFGVLVAVINCWKRWDYMCFVISIVWDSLDGGVREDWCFQDGYCFRNDRCFNRNVFIELWEDRATVNAVT